MSLLFWLLFLGLLYRCFEVALDPMLPLMLPDTTFDAAPPATYGRPRFCGLLPCLGCYDVATPTCATGCCPFAPLRWLWRRATLLERVFICWSNLLELAVCCPMFYVLFRLPWPWLPRAVYALYRIISYRDGQIIYQILIAIKLLTIFWLLMMLFWLDDWTCTLLFRFCVGLFESRIWLFVLFLFAAATFFKPCIWLAIELTTRTNYKSSTWHKKCDTIQNECFNWLYRLQTSRYLNIAPAFLGPVRRIIFVQNCAVVTYQLLEHSSSILSYLKRS